MLLFQSSFKLNLKLCYFLTVSEFVILLGSPSHFLGRDILNKVQAFVFMNMEPTLSLSLIEQNLNLKVGLMVKLWFEHKMMFLLLSSSETLTYFHNKSNK